MTVGYGRKGKPIPVQSYRADRRRPGHVIHRDCNSCGREFWTSSRFIRKCAYCKELVWLDDMDAVTVYSVGLRHFELAVRGLG